MSGADPVNPHVILERLAAFGPEAAVPASDLIRGEPWHPKTVGCVLAELQWQGKVRAVQKRPRRLWRALRYPDGAPVRAKQQTESPAAAGKSPHPVNPEPKRTAAAGDPPSPVASARQAREGYGARMPQGRVARGGRTKRACLCCGKDFMSEGIHNRLCDYCRAKGDALA